MKPWIGAILIAMSLSACASRAPSSPPESARSPRWYFENAKAGNWRLRAFTGDTMYEGKVSFVQSATARIGNATIAFTDVERLDRSKEIDQGGKLTGALIGGAVGALLGAAAVSFHEYGTERNCDALCSARIVLPTIGGVAIIGGLIGGAVGPAKREWVTVWQRP